MRYVIPRLGLHLMLLSGLALGALALGLAAPASHQIGAFAALVAIATVMQLFRAELPNHITFFATPACFFAGVLLLDPSLYVLLVAIPHLAEWVRQRILAPSSVRLRAWYLQPFNMAKVILAGSAAHALYSALGGASGALPTLAAVPAGLVFLVLNEASVGLALVLARGISWRDSGVLHAENLSREGLLLALGIAAAALWRAEPWLLLPGLAPLVLLYQALRITRIREETEIDAQTGLYHERHFQKHLASELERARRLAHPLALIVADVDGLRQINERDGRAAGDAVLAEIGRVIRKSVRGYDIAGRIGGEEVAIALPEIGWAEARAIAERLRETIAVVPVSLPDGSSSIQATMSFGLACFPDHASSADELLRMANGAMYHAKVLGRNQVMSAADVPSAIALDSVQPSHAGSTSSNGAATDHAAASAPDALPPAEPPPHPPDAAPAPRPRVSARQGPSWYGWLTQRVFQTTVILAGLLMIGLAWPGSSWAPPLTLALLFALALLAELLQIGIYDESSTSVAVALAVAAALIAGVPGVVVASSAIAIADYLRQQRPVWRLGATAFTWATHLLAGCAPALAIRILDIPLQMVHLFPLILLTVSATAVYYVVETGLTSIAIGIAKRRSALAIWRVQYRWLARHYLALGMMGLFLGLAYTAMGLPRIIVFVLPPLMVRYAQEQYVTRTAASLRELQRMNAELSRANHEVGTASRSIEQLNGRLLGLNDELFITLGMILDARDPYVVGHAAQVAAYAMAVGAELGLPPAQVEVLRQAGFLHDIGKIAISEQILYKPAKLTDEEYAIMKTHAAIGAQLLERSTGLRHLAPFIRHHHERWDGRGYPDGLRSEEIPFEARILNVCDSVEAMASDRPYHQGMSPEQIISEIRRSSGTQFDPLVAEAFLRVLHREGLHFVVNSAHVVAREQAEGRGLLSARNAG